MSEDLTFPDRPSPGGTNATGVPGVALVLIRLFIGYRKALLYTTNGVSRQVTH